MEKKTARELFDEFRSMYAVLMLDEVNCKMVQICGYHEGKIIVGYKNNDGLIAKVRQGILFDEGHVDNKSWDIVDVEQLVFVCHGVKYKD